MSRLFRLSDEAWAAIEPHLQRNLPEGDEVREIAHVRYAGEAAV